MADDLADETTIPRARDLAQQALEAIDFPANEEGIADLIADLMHLADEALAGLDPAEVGPVMYDEGDEDAETMGYAVMYSARRHYEAELP